MPVTELRPPARRSSSTRFEPAALPPRRPRALPPVRIRPEDLQDPFPDFTEQIDQRALAAARRAHPSGRSGGRSGQAPAPRVTAKPAKPARAATPGTAGQTGRAGAAPLAQPALSGGRAGGSGSRSIASARGLPAAVGAAAAQPLAERSPRPLPRPERGPDLRVVEGPSRAERRRHRRMVSLASLCTFGVALAFFGAVVLHAKLAQGQVRLDNIQRAVTAAEKQRTVLRATVAGLESPARIVAAAGRLGLVSPARVVFVSSSSSGSTGDSSLP